MKCNRSYLHHLLELNAENPVADGGKIGAGQITKALRESSPAQEDLWYPLVDWLRENRRLKGARLVFDAMDLWASNINILQNVFGLSHEQAKRYNMENCHPVQSLPMDMTDRQTICQCVQRIEQLELKGKKLSASEKEELTAIKKYLSHTTYQGRSKIFPDELSKATKRNREAVKYLLKILDQEKPALALYARAHLKLTPVLRWS